MLSLLFLLCAYQSQDVVRDNGLRLHVVQEGSGPPLLLIGGLGNRLQVWDAVVPSLANHFTVVRFDHRGLGQSGDLADAPYTLATMAEDAAAVMAALGHERYHLAGISLGSFVAQQLALTQPERIVKLVLIASSLGGPQHVAPGPEVLGYFMTMAGMPRPERVDKGLRLALHSDFIEARPAVFAALTQAGIEDEPPAKTIQRQMMVGMTFNHAEKARDIQVPTLLLHGAGDQVVPPENSRRLNEAIAGSALVILPEAGHLCIVDQARATAVALVAFLVGG